MNVPPQDFWSICPPGGRAAVIALNLRRFGESAIPWAGDSCGPAGRGTEGRRTAVRAGVQQRAR
jgi:hypothetical protein